MKLTKRGRIVRNIFIVVIFYLIFSYLFNVTTPKECKVPIDEMSHFCIDLLYPHS
jgi:hypothetical protein